MGMAARGIWFWFVLHRATFVIWCPWWRRERGQDVVLLREGIASEVNEGFWKKLGLSHQFGEVSSFTLCLQYPLGCVSQVWGLGRGKGRKVREQGQSHIIWSISLIINCGDFRSCFLWKIVIPTHVWLLPAADASFMQPLREKLYTSSDSLFKLQLTTNLDC